MQTTKMRLLLSLALALAAGASSAQAEVIVSRTGDVSFTCCEFGGVAVWWTQDATWTNVRVDLTLYNSDGSGAQQTGAALLLNSLGPGTTPANEIDDAVIAVSGGGVHTVTAFSGLTLGPGTYYLLYWRVSGSQGDLLTMGFNTFVPTATGPGVTNVQFALEDIFHAAPYRPASPYTVWGNGSSLMQITGTRQADPATVPEPSSLGLAALGVGSVLWMQRRRRPASAGGITPVRPVPTTDPADSPAARLPSPVWKQAAEARLQW